MGQLFRNVKVLEEKLEDAEADVEYIEPRRRLVTYFKVKSCTI